MNLYEQLLAMQPKVERRYVSQIAKLPRSVTYQQVQTILRCGTSMATNVMREAIKHGDYVRCGSGKYERVKK